MIFFMKLFVIEPRIVRSQKEINSIFIQNINWLTFDLSS